MSVRQVLACLGLFGVIAAVGCASDDLQTSVTHDPLALFPPQATFAWDSAANRLPTDESIVALDLDPLIREAANQEFALRGYRVVTSGSPDYRLSYQLAVHTWISANNSSSAASLSLLLVDAKLSRRVWLGYGRATVNVGVSRDERRTDVRAAIAKMLEKFPPNQGRS